MLTKHGNPTPKYKRKKERKNKIQVCPVLGISQVEREKEMEAYLDFERERLDYMMVKDEMKKWDASSFLHQDIYFFFFGLFLSIIY